MMKRLYATAEEARWALDDIGPSHPHTWLGGICEEAECYCGIQMPVDEKGNPKLTFEEWLDYHDRVQLETLEADGVAYRNSGEYDPKEWSADAFLQAP